MRAGGLGLLVLVGCKGSVDVPVDTPVYTSVLSATVTITNQADPPLQCLLLFPRGASRTTTLDIATRDVSPSNARITLGTDSGCGSDCELPTIYTGHLEAGHATASEGFYFSFPGFKGDDCSIQFATKLDLIGVDPAVPGPITGTITFQAFRSTVLDHTMGGDGCQFISPSIPCGGMQTVTGSR